MAEQAEKSVLRRKAGAHRAAQGLAEMTPPKAMRVALAKAGDKVLKVPVSLRDFKNGSLSPDDLATALPDPALILRMDGLGGTVGLAVLCPQTVAAVIEAQTMGRVSQGAAADRKATATDASMACEFVDLVIEGFAILAEECRSLPAIEGYKVTGRFVDARAAAMAMEDAVHLHLTAELDAASGAKSGVLHFVLPTRQRRLATGAEEGGWSATLEKAVMSCPARLEAILCRFKLPLSDATNLSPGQVLPLTPASLDSVKLIALNGRNVMAAQLGRSGSMRAVRMNVDGKARRPTAPRKEMGSLSVRVAGAGPAPGFAASVPGGPSPMADLPGSLDDLPGPVADLPATLAAVPLTMDLDLPE